MLVRPAKLRALDTGSAGVVWARAPALGTPAATV